MNDIETAAREFARVWTDDPNLATFVAGALNCQEFSALADVITAGGGDISHWLALHRAALQSPHATDCRKGASP